MARTATSQPPMPGWGRLVDGQTLIVVLFVLALVIGVLAGLGARRFTHRADPGQTHVDSDIPPEATRLGYRAGRDFRNDQARASRAMAEVLAAGAGAQRLWQNAETGNRGIVWASAETHRPDGTSCRNLVQRTLINGAFRNAEAISCRVGDGWEQTGWRSE